MIGLGIVALPRTDLYLCGFPVRLQYRCYQTEHSYPSPDSRAQLIGSEQMSSDAIFWHVLFTDQEYP